VKQLLNILLSVIGKRGIAKYIFLGFVSGFCSFLFINTITHVISIMVSGNLTLISVEYLLIFAFIVLIFIWARRLLALYSISIVQKIGWQLRMEILALVLKTNYEQVIPRKTNIQTAILSDVGALTNASMSTVDLFIQLIMTVSCLSYLAYISFILFVVTFITSAAGVAVYMYTSKKNMEGFEKARKQEDKFQANFNTILGGFKEIFMEPKKGNFIYKNRICVNANESYNQNISTLSALINNQIIGQVLFYILVTSILLIFSVVLKISPPNTVAFIFTLLYLSGSIEAIVQLLPNLMRAGIASNHLMDLRKDLEQIEKDPVLSSMPVFKKTFSQLNISQLGFKFTRDDKEFAIGPVSLSIKKGDIIFIYGANGSGKTTFINTLLGLYKPQTGKIVVDDTEVDENNFPEYRTLFSTVFSDFYLFDEIIGVDDLDFEKWEFYIQTFELDKKTSIQNGNFSNIDLSTGQRKRLALISALLEKKPVLVIDEWAADQDPYFRKKFYTEIIPSLKKEGTTVIAITHDDKYYYCADRLFKMDEGKLVEEIIPQTKPFTGESEMTPVA
jgi:putative pyoverdin transport system ATP-binding/permease protein